MRFALLGLVVLAGGCPERNVDTPPGVIDRASCAFDDPEDPDAAVLAHVVDRTVFLVRGDGGGEPLHTFASKVTTTWIDVRVDARDGFLVAWAQYDDGASGTVLEAALFTADGVPLWTRAFGPGNDLVYLGSDGQVAITGWAGGTVVVAPSGDERALGGFYAQTGPLADGTVAVSRIGWGSFVWGWSHPGDAEPEVAAFEPVFNDVRFAGERAIYATWDDAGAWQLVDETPERVRLVPLPLGPEEYPYFASVNEGWVLLQDASTQLPLVLVDLVRGDAVRLAITLPEGHRTFNYTQWDAPRIDDQGALLLSLRDDAVGGLFRSLDRGLTWRRVGEAVTDVLGVTAQARGGTYVVAATNLLYSWEEWPEDGAAGAIAGDSMQVVRPEVGVLDVTTVANQAELGASISPDGRCVATWGAMGLSVIDTDTAYEHVLGVSPPVGAPGIAWLTP